MSITDVLCRKIVAIEAEAIPVQAWELANQVVLDGIAVAVAGAAELPPRILADYFREQGGNPVASMVGCGYKGTLFQAAYVNAASMHVLDYEPMSNPSTHATSPVLPGILALAEWREYDGRELALATPPMRRQDRPQLNSGLEGKFRHQYTIACALVDGRVGIDHFTDECLSRPDIAAMLAKVRVAYDDNREADDEAYWVKLAVQTLSGEIFTSECEYPAGHFHLPVLSLERHRTKLHECLGRTFGPVEEEEIIALAVHFDQLKNKEVKRLMELVSRPRVELRKL